jgi:hypothetical protein
MLLIGVMAVFAWRKAKHVGNSPCNTVPILKTRRIYTFETGTGSIHRPHIPLCLDSHELSIIIGLCESIQTLGGLAGVVKVPYAGVGSQAEAREEHDGQRESHDEKNVMVNESKKGIERDRNEGRGSHVQVMRYKEAQAWSVAAIEICARINGLFS